jgi:hypothetical protein
VHVARAAHVAVKEGSGQPLSSSSIHMQLLPEQQQEFERMLNTPLPELMSEAAALRDQGHRCITFSPKVGAAYVNLGRAVPLKM